MFTRYCEGDGLDDGAAHAVVRDAGVEALVVAGQVGQLQHGARGQRVGRRLALGRVLAAVPGDPCWRPPPRLAAQLRVLALHRGQLARGRGQAHRGRGREAQLVPDGGGGVRGVELTLQHSTQLRTFCT